MSGQHTNGQRFQVRMMGVLSDTLDWYATALHEQRKKGGELPKGARRRLDDVTVLSSGNDPFRLGLNPDNHVIGQWLADELDALGIDQLHCRGIHYRLLGRIKPDGTPYMNDDATWTWLQEKAAKAARWLGYIDFERITDERNMAPVLVIRPPVEPEAELLADVNVELPVAADFNPSIDVDGFEGRQRFRLALVGEKSSLAPVLRPLSEEFDTDLLLPTGELSDTMIHALVKAAAQDRRPTRVFYISDCDPAGWQMAISLARKVQALKESMFAVDIQIYRVALTPEQVDEHGLPSTPLKAGELRSEAWVDAFGIEQTEVDAVPPALMEQWVREALEPFYDDTLDERVEEARADWLAEAQQALDDAIDAKRPGARARLLDVATKKLARMTHEIERLNETARRLLERVETSFMPPPFDVPEPEYDEAEIAALPEPVYDTSWDHLTATWRLMDMKRYRD